MRQKGRRVPPPDAATIRRAHITTEMPSAAAWDAAEAQRTLDTHVIAAGTAQHRVSGLWHTWVSLYGADLTSWYVGPDGPTAYAIALAIKELFSTWTYTDADGESMDALLAVAHEKSSDPQATLPDDQVRELLAEVAVRQVRKN